MFIKNLTKPSLLKKFLLAFLLVALIPLGIAEYRTVMRAEEELKTVLNEQYYLIIDQVRRTMDEGYIYQWITGLRNLVISLNSANASDLALQNTILDSYLKMVNELIVLEMQRSDSPNPFIFMKNEFVNELFVQDGNSVSVIFQFSEGTATADNEYRILDPLLLPNSGKMFLPIEFPLRWQTGETAVIRAVFDIDAILGFISEEVSGGHRELYIVDANGKIVFTNRNGKYGPGQELPYSIMNSVQGSLSGGSRAFQLENFVHGERKMLGNYTVSQYISWATVVVDDYNLAYALITQTKKDIIIWVAIAVGLCVLFSVIFARSFSKRIAYLASTSKKIGGGNLDVKIEIPSRDEIGQLARSLQEMVSSLRDAVKVREKLITIEQEVKIAGRIQQSILPVGAPRMEGLNFSARYIPMAGVAGDFYDYHIIGERKLGVLVADVSGHGIPAALISAMVKIAFSQQKHIAEEPGKTLKAMNHMLCGKMEDQFLTASYLLIDLEKNQLLIADAGHLPLLIWRRSSNELIKIKPKGMIMGYMDGVDFPFISADLKLGDRLIMYTDGVVEAHNPDGEQFNEERFVKLIREGQELKPADFVERTVTVLTDWVNNEEGFEDDVTLTVIDISDGQPVTKSSTKTEGNRE